MKTVYTNFKVINVSSNTNSFGLHGVIICDKTGLAFEVGVSAINCPKVGNYVTGVVDEQENLRSLPFTYEIPRKLPKPDAETLKEMFTGVEKKVVKRVNVAKGKTITKPVDFAKVFDTLDVTKKTEVIKNLNNVLSTGISPSGLKMTESERPAIEQLLRWCNINILIGGELCPPEKLHSY